MQEHTNDLKHIEQVFIKQFKECAGFKFFNEFKTREIRTEDIPDLIQLIDLIRNHEKEIGKQRLELEMKIINHRISTLKQM